MREIKFREWETERKTMSYGKRENYDDMVGFRFEHEEGGERILMQYTGLKDVNGKEIYEGDILKGGFLIDQQIHDCIGLLAFKNYGFVVEVPGFGDEDLIDWEDAEEIEVIGNIYENPELLAKE